MNTLTLGTYIFIVLAYLMGSVSSAIIVCKIIGKPDPRTTGSLNPGATNVLRIAGKGPAIVTLIGDALKGLIPVLLAKWFGLPDIGISLVMLAAFLGHLFPVFFKFKGGKGVATAFGCIVGLNVLAGLSLFVTWLFIAFLFRYSSLAALLSAILGPVYVFNFTHQEIYGFTSIVISLILIYRHRSNIQKLLSGTEKKIGG